MMIKKSKSSFFITTDSEPDSDSDSEFDYEQGDCFDLDGECKPIPRVVKNKLCDKTRIKNYILFSTITSLFGYILYNTICELYK